MCLQPSLSEEGHVFIWPFALLHNRMSFVWRCQYVTRHPSNGVLKEYEEKGQQRERAGVSHDAEHWWQPLRVGPGPSRWCGCVCRSIRLRSCRGHVLFSSEAKLSCELCFKHEVKVHLEQLGSLLHNTGLQVMPILVSQFIPQLFLSFLKTWLQSIWTRCLCRLESRGFTSHWHSSWRPLHMHMCTQYGHAVKQISPTHGLTQDFATQRRCVNFVYLLWVLFICLTAKQSAFLGQTWILVVPALSWTC